MWSIWIYNFKHWEYFQIATREKIHIQNKNEVHQPIFKKKKIEQTTIIISKIILINHILGAKVF